MEQKCAARTYCVSSLYDCWLYFGVAYIKEHGDIPKLSDMHEHVRHLSYTPSALYQVSRRVDDDLRRFKDQYAKWRLVKDDHKGWCINMTGNGMWRAEWDGNSPCPIVKECFQSLTYSVLISNMMSATRHDKYSGKYTDEPNM